MSEETVEEYRMIINSAVVSVAMNLPESCPKSGLIWQNCMQIIIFSKYYNSSLILG